MRGDGTRRARQRRAFDAAVVAERELLAALADYTGAYRLEKAKARSAEAEARLASTGYVKKMKVLPPGAFWTGTYEDRERP